MTDKAKTFDPLKAAPKLAKLAKRKTGVTRAEAMTALQLSSSYQWQQTLDAAKAQFSVVCQKRGQNAVYGVTTA